MPDKDLDPVEWELVRADIAMEKARLKANGDWAKWEEFQAESNAIRAGRAAPADRTARAAGARSPAGDEERAALWWAIRTPELSWLTGPPRRPRRRGWPFRLAQPLCAQGPRDGDSEALQPAPRLPGHATQRPRSETVEEEALHDREQ